MVFLLLQHSHPAGVYGGEARQAGRHLDQVPLVHNDVLGLGLDAVHFRPVRQVGLARVKRLGNF